jgi:hypothetical protein
MLSNPQVFNRFAVCEPPKPDESAKGFFLRLSAENGRQTLKELAQAINYRAVKSSFEAGGKDFFNFITALAKSHDLSASSLVSCFSVSKLLVDDDRAVKRIVTPNPKVCPECMKNGDTAYIKSEWDLAHHTHCKEHQVRLLQTCPCCENELRWAGDVFLGCPTCGLRWQDYVAKSEQVPLYQSICSRLSDLEMKVYLQALYQAFVFVSRPLDLIFDDFHSMPEGLSDYPHYFEKAYRLISDQAFLNNWTEMRLSVFSKEVQFAALNHEQLEKLASLPLKFTDISFLPKYQAENFEVQWDHKTQNSMVSPLRKDISSDPLDMRFQIGLEGAASLLGVNIATVKSFIETGLLSIYNESSLSRIQIVSIGNISDLMSMVSDQMIKLPYPEYRDDLVSIKKLQKLFPFYSCDLASLLKHINKQNCQTYCKPNETFSLLETYIREADATQCLEDHFYSSLEFQTTDTQVRNLSGLQNKPYFILKEEFGLGNERNTSNLNSVNPSKVADFFHQYVLLNRWAKIQKVKLEVVANYLKTIANLSIYSKLEKEGIYLYEQSPELEEALARFLIYHKGEYQLLAQLIN